MNIFRERENWEQQPYPQETKRVTATAELLDAVSHVQGELKSAKLVLSRAALSSAEATLLSTLMVDSISKVERKKRVDQQFRLMDSQKLAFGKDIKSELHPSLMQEALAVVVSPC